jgi:hypothetical protein
MPKLQHNDAKLFLQAARAGFIEAFIMIQNGDVKPVPPKGDARLASVAFMSVINPAAKHASEKLLREFEAMGLNPASKPPPKLNGG